jgi:hypothetical protein
MSSIIPFESDNLPSYLKASSNEDLTAHAGGGFPVISIKGKIFTTIRDGERRVLPNPKDPDSPASSIEVVIVKANKNTSKVFYANGYTEGSDKKPDCYSNDGIAPDASAENPQAKKCAICPQNQWGAKTTADGKKGKACSDSVRIAVSTVDLINDPYLIRVPATSIRGLGEFGTACAKRGVAYNGVIAKISFDMETPTPKLVFKPIGFLDERKFAQVKQAAQSESVRNILGAAYEFSDSADPAVDAVEQAKTSSKAAVSRSKQVTAEEIVDAVERAEGMPELPKKAKAPASEEVDVAIDLDDLKFD